MERSEQMRTQCSRFSERAMSNRPSNFDDDLAAGAEGVERVTEYLRSRGYLVTDVQSDPKYQAMDIDLLACKEGSGKQMTVEVKADRYPDINQTLTWEVVSSVGNAQSKGRAGWSLTTDAEWMAYYSPQSQTVRLFRTSAMREYISRHAENKWGAAVCGNKYAWLKEGQRHTSISLKVPLETGAIEAIGGKTIYLRQRGGVAN